MRSSTRRPKKTPATRPSALTFFVDRDLGGKIVPNRLRIAGLNVVAHDEQFKSDTNDVDWLRAAGENRWVVLSKNEDIRRVTLERDVLLAARVRCFFVTATATTAQEAADLIIAALPQIQRHCRGRSGRGFIAKITQGPKVTRLA